jgi:hypothetical protein
MRAMATRVAVALAAFVVAASVYLPIIPEAPELEPDLSFRATTHDAFARGLQLGSDIVSTYGPWGLLQRGYDPRTDTATLLVLGLLAAVFAWSVTRIAYDAGGNAAAALVAAVAAACLVPPDFDARFTVLALLLILSALLPPSRARELPLVAALGVVALVKMSLLALAIFAIVMLTLVRRRAIYAAVFLGAFLAAWLAAGQHLGGLPRFLRWGAEVARGYSAASASGAGVPLAVAGAAGLAVVIVLVERNLLRIVLLGAPLAYLAKVGFVRSDVTHESSAAALLCLFAVAYLLLRRDAMPHARRAVVAAAAIAALVVVAMVLDPFASRMRAQWRWMHGRAARVAAVERDIAFRSGAALVPPAAGTIDAYPWGSAALIVRGMRYTPRPVFQSCMAWTPALAELNAEFLRGPRAPEWLWTGVGSIDGRYPLLDDAPSWVEMMRRYDAGAPTSEHVLLHKRAAPRTLTTTDAGNVRAALDVDVAVPAAPVVWCVIDARPTPTGIIKDLFGRPSLMTLELATEDGNRTSWRVSREMLGGGFIVSPAVTEIGALSALLSGRAAARVVRVRLTGGGVEEPVLFRFSAISQRP